MSDTGQLQKQERELSAWQAAEVAFRRDRQARASHHGQSPVKAAPRQLFAQIPSVTTLRIGSISLLACGTPTHLVKKGAHLGDPGGGLLVDDDVGVGQHHEPLPPSGEEFVFLQPE